MRVAALYDIHANLPALEAVLQDVRRTGVDQIVIGGDVLPGPMPRETLACLLNVEIPVQFIQGNGDREVLEVIRGMEPTTAPQRVHGLIRWTAEQVAEYEAVLASWQKTLPMRIVGCGEVLFCHATPRNDVEIFSRLTPEDRLSPAFEGVTAQLVVCGHTHMQFDRMVGGTRVVNAGSVGMPFGQPGAYWLLLGDEVQLRRTAFDLEDAAERIRNTSYPEAREFADRNVLQPPSEEEMIKAFARVELK